MASGAAPDIGFTGHVNDADTGLTYMQQRYYDPVAGRFLSIDPMVTDASTGGGFNRYAYANSNPYRYIDGDGRQARDIKIDCMTGNCLTFGSLTSNSRSSDLANRTSAQYSFTTMGSVLESGLDYYILALSYAVPETAAAERIAGSASIADITVGRWMSREEHELILATGKVQESWSGTTHVASPANVESFLNQAKTGSRYIEFGVPINSLKKTSEGWAKVIGPNSLEGRLAAKKGLPLPEMPSASDIKWIASKLH